MFELIIRNLKKTDAQLSFLVRLLGQFSSSERNYFAEEFTSKEEGDKILYYKIYQSIWKSNVSNENNLKQLAALFTGLESNALKYLSDITGDYLLSVTLNKLAEFTKGLVEGEMITSVLENITKEKPGLEFGKFTSAVISIINSPHTPGSVVNRILAFTKGLAFGYDLAKAIIMTDNDKFDRFTYDTVLEQINEILIALGHLKQEDGESSLNKILQGYMPEMGETIDNWYKGYTKQLNSQDLNQVIQKIKQVFQQAQMKYNKAVDQENSFVRFLLDVLIPGLDSVNPFVARTLYRGYNKKAEEQAMAKIKAMCQTASPRPFQCEVAKFMERMSTARKDQSFVDIFLGEFEILAVKFIEKMIRNQVAEANLVSYHYINH